MEEIEVKFLNVDKADIENRLSAIGANKVGEFFYRRQVFDFPGFTLDSQGAWVRLRDEGDRIALGFKKRIGMSKDGGSDVGTEEVEVEVKDFDKTKLFLHRIGMIDKFYQENKRTRYEKDGVEFDIDEWPRLNPYLEIESDSWEKIDEAISWLGLDPADKKIYPTHEVYKLAGIRELDYIKMGFDEFVERDKDGE